MGRKRGLIHAVVLDGQGGARQLDPEEAFGRDRDEGLTWIHLDRKAHGVKTWMTEGSGLAPVAQGALMADATRPRKQAFADGLLVILRGVNQNPGKAPDDMISVRVWLDSKGIITLRSPKLYSISELYEESLAGHAPKDQGDFLIALTDKLSDKMMPVLDNLESQIEEIHDSEDKASPELRSQLSGIRRQIMNLRRYLAPQRDVLSTLSRDPGPWLTEEQKGHIREEADRVTRFVEDLDTAREHASIVQDAIDAHLSDATNRKMYVLSIVAGVFLPIGFLAGLLGVNLGGIPGSENPWAFAIFCILLVALGVLEIMFFKWKKWL